MRAAAAESLPRGCHPAAANLRRRSMCPSSSSCQNRA